MQKSKRQICDSLKAQMTTERSSFVPHWRQLSENILPRRSRFFVTDKNDGAPRDHKIIDNTGTLSARTLRSGMMSGVTSPARPWFKLSNDRNKNSQSDEVKRWLESVENEMKAIFIKSNLYNVLPVTYGDLGVFGTAAILMEEDLEKVVRFTSMPIGSYMIANDSDGKVAVFFREFQMTVRQIIEKFAKKNSKGDVIDWSNISSSVRSAYDNKSYESWFTVNHIIMPNHDYKEGNPLSKYKKFTSTYYENSSNDSGQDTFLRESGFDYFPVLAPRWEVTGEDVYGTQCPGMVTLGDIKQLQLGEKRIFQAVEKMINPPMVAPVSMKNRESSILPGAVTYVDSKDSKGGYRPAHEVRFDINPLEAKQSQTRQRVQRGFFEDLFLMLANSDRRQITAREIEERHEEKLLALGPVLEQLNQDLLDPLIDNTFSMMVKQGLIPEPPEELEGVDLKVEYVSIMAQAQKLAGIANINRFMGAMGQAAQVYPSIGKKINPNSYVDIYKDLTGVPASLVRSDEEVSQMEAAEAEQARQQQAAEQQAMMVNQAKELSQIDTKEQNALTDMVSAAQGAG